MRLRAGVVAVAVALTGCAATAGSGVAVSGLPEASAPVPTAAPADAADVPSLADNAEQVTMMLDDVAAAFLAGDPDALRPHLSDPDSPFGERWLRRAADMRDVPFTEYSLQLDTSGADLTSGSVPGEGGLLVNVLEEHQLAGFEDLGPVREHLFLTLQEQAGRWTVASDRAGEPLGLVSADHLWDHGPVMATERGPLLALHHPGQASVTTLLDEAQRALATTEQRWPLSWPGRVPLLIPADQDELGELLHVTFELDNFIAFATTTPIRDLGAVEMSGSRVMLNTERFLTRSAETRERILVHELVHAASRPAAAPAVPSWLEEGVAQALGERRSTTGTSLLAALADTDWEGSLPLDAEFSAGDRDDTFLSYQRSWSFVDWLQQRHGTETVGAFYRAVGQGAAGTPGTDDARVDRAARAVFDAPFTELVAQWRASL